MDSNGLFISPREYFTSVVEDGFAARKIKAQPQVKAYLIGLLEHYMDSRNLFENEVQESGKKTPQTLAEMFLQAQNEDTVTKVELLRKLGDRSLYISGFFGDSLERKLVDVDYYVEMGGTAYASLAAVVREDTTAQVYRIFSKRFVEFVDVLSFISQKSMITNNQSILRLYDRYLRTGSDLARDQLIEMGVLTVDRNQIKTSTKF